MSTGSKLPKTQYLKHDATDFTYEFTRDKQEAVLNGKAFKLISYSDGFRNHLFGPKAFKNQIYSMLAHDLHESYGLIIPHRFENSWRD